MDHEQVTISEKRYKGLIKKEEMYISLIDVILQSKEEAIVYEKDRIVAQENEYKLTATELDKHIIKFKNHMEAIKYD